MTAHEPADPPAEAAADKPTPEQPPAEEPDQADPEPADPEPADPEPADPEPADPEPADPEPEGSAPDEAEPEDADPEDAEPEDAEPEDAEPEDAEPEDAEPEDAEPEDAEPEDAEPEDAEPGETGPDEADAAESEAEPEIEPAAGEDADDRPIEVIGEGDHLDEDEEPRPAGFDKRPDVYTWILVPVATLILGPAIAASVMFFVAVSTKGYPSICPSVYVENGCENSILRMADHHTVAFLAGWLLLWALPWWRGLRAYRIGFAVALALVLVAIPLRLIHTIHLGGDV